MKAGHELDWAVAEAIGLDTAAMRTNDERERLPPVMISPREWDELRGVEHVTCEGDVACIPFQPSTDLNAAFAAAEKVGLFDNARLSSWNGKWEVRWSPTENCWGPTPALAICVAILKLKDKA